MSPPTTNRPAARPRPAAPGSDSATLVVDLTQSSNDTEQGSSPLTPVPDWVLEQLAQPDQPASPDTVAPDPAPAPVTGDAASPARGAIQAVKADQADPADQADQSVQAGQSVQADEPHVLASTEGATAQVRPTHAALHHAARSCASDKLPPDADKWAVRDWLKRTEYRLSWLAPDARAIFLAGPSCTAYDEHLDHAMWGVVSSGIDANSAARSVVDLQPQLASAARQGLLDAFGDLTPTDGLEALVEALSLLSPHAAPSGENDGNHGDDVASAATRTSSTARFEVLRYRFEQVFPDPLELWRQLLIRYIGNDSFTLQCHGLSYTDTLALARTFHLPAQDQHTMSVRPSATSGSFSSLKPLVPPAHDRLDHDELGTEGSTYDGSILTESRDEGHTSMINSILHEASVILEALSL